ncbi:MAG: peptidylprolyl isomerase [Chitinophagaceae bacterium]|nr:peptidylprolyl isomerase [Rubrivivax sp.]
MQRRQLFGLAALAGTPGSRPAAIPQPAPVLTRVDTALGDFVIAVDPARAPATVANYLAYVDRGLLDGGSVYRIVTPANQTPDTRHKIEVVQWGMHRPAGQPSPWPAIAHETTQQTGLRHRDGTVSMARGAPGTATSEFFICIGDQPELDFGGGRNLDGQGFAAFGQVVAGQAVVRALYAQAQAKQFIEPTIAVRTVRRSA